MKHNHNFCVYFSSRPFAISQNFFASSIFKMSIHKIMRTANIIRRNHHQHKTNVRSFHWNLSRNRILFEIGVPFVHLIYTYMCNKNGLHFEACAKHDTPTLRMQTHKIQNGKSKTLLFLLSFSFGFGFQHLLRSVEFVCFFICSSFFSLLTKKIVKKKSFARNKPLCKVDLKLHSLLVDVSI